MNKLISFILLLFFSLQSMNAQEEEQRYVPDPDPAIRERINEWQDLKFGLLMHWGTYSQWGIVESWSICPEDEGWCVPDTVQNYFAYKTKYENLIKTFNPVLFDPQKWANAAQDAGMKYVVFTTKHHDGFCMFDSKYTDYKITSADCPFHTNPKADVTKEIFNAFRQKGLWIGAYFSKPDWHCPYYWWPQFPPFDRNVNYDIEQYPDKWKQYVDFTHNQVMELCTQYGQIDILWFDGGWVHKQDLEGQKPFLPGYRLVPDSSLAGHRESPYIPGYRIKKAQNQDVKMDELVSKIRSVQPKAIVVDRAVPGKNQNYLTPENTVPTHMLPYPWESCIIMGGGWSFSYNASMKPTRELIHLLTDIVAKGGNLLLNIGPGPDGTWYPEAYDRLKEIGAWMRINGEGIYGSRPQAPYVDGKWRFTQSKDGVVNAYYLLDEKENQSPESLLLTGIKPLPGASVQLNGSQKSLKWKNEGDKIRIFLPSGNKSEYAIGFRISTISNL